ncbi:ATP-binding protein [Rhizohabitans arisaemae]|uniref:ATP-binding protein n=1 Tax=Rhizohabitans arisaemae TaxID=2720610 RepID=UPI0024B1DBDD|nr:ATP-binding protein [Rhizohabitans arisaemae]
MLDEPVSTTTTGERRFLRGQLESVFRPRVTTPPSHTYTLSTGAGSVRVARDATRSALQSWGLAPLVDDAALVVSELVTNAIRHAALISGRPITLTLMRQPAHVMCAVADPSDAVPIPKEPDFISESGRGLYIVETYSYRWGWDPLDDGGKAVWALFRTIC